MNAWEIEPNYMKYNYQEIKLEIKRHKLGFLLGYFSVDKNNELYGKDYFDVINDFKSIAELTYSDFDGDYWKFGIDFGHFKDYIPNDTITESMVSQFSIFTDDPIEKDFLNDLSKFIKENQAKVSDYKSIDHAISVIEKLAEKALTFQKRVLN